MALLVLKNLLFQRGLQHSEIFRESVMDEENKTCRVCRHLGEIDIFKDFNGKDILNDIRLCSGVAIYRNDGLPRWICMECYNLLQTAVKFRQMCKESQSILKGGENGKLTHKLFEISMDGDTMGLASLADGQDYFAMSPDNNAEYTELGTVSEPIQYNVTPTEKKFRDCKYCKMSFSNWRIYKKHSSTCWQKAKAKKLREKGFKTENIEGVQKILCEVCGKALSSIHSLETHKTIHEDVFPYKCDLCPYQGKTVGLLKVHQRRHLAVKPYSCDRCPRVFVTISNCKRHMRVHEESSHVQCEQCEKVFKNADSLKKHRRLTHQFTGPSVCDLCSKTYKTSRGLSKHRKKVHKIFKAKGRLPSYILAKIQNADQQQTRQIVEAYRKISDLPLTQSEMTSDMPELL